MRITSSKCLAGAALMAVLLYADRAHAVSGTIDFDVDPGFTIEDGGDANVVVNVRTAQSVMDLTLTRDQAVERVTLPLGMDFTGNENNFKGRLRFAAKNVSDGPFADIISGFFASSEGTASGGSTTAAVIEAPEAVNYPARIFGGAYDRRDLDIDLLTWYVYEFEFQAVPETAVLRLYEGNGTTLIDEIIGGGTSGIDGAINLIGFGNEDRSQDAAQLTAVIDFMTWAVNDTLPQDPAFAPDSAIIPEPGTALLLGLFVMAWTGFVRRRRQ